MDENDAVMSEAQAGDARRKVPDQTLSKSEQEGLKAMTKYKKETIGRCNWNVVRIIKGNSKTKYRDVTALVMEVLKDVIGLSRDKKTHRHKCALAHCINAKPTKVEGARPYPPERTLETMSTAPTTEYDYKIIQAAFFFRIRVTTINRMLLLLEQKIQAKDLPVLDKFPLSEVVPNSDYESDMDSVPSSESGMRDHQRAMRLNMTLAQLAEEDEERERELEDRLEEEREEEGGELNDAEMPDLHNAPPLAGDDVPAAAAAVMRAAAVDDVTAEEAEQRRRDNDTRPFHGDMLDETKPRYDRFRSFIDQIFYWVDDPYEQEVLEWLVKCMVHPSAYNDIPDVIQRDKVLEYFKVLLPSLHASPFTIEPAWFRRYLTKERVIKIQRSRVIDEEGTEEDQLELARIVEQVEAERKVTKAEVKARRKEMKEEKAKRDREDKEREDAEKEERRKRKEERKMLLVKEEQEDDADDEQEEEEEQMTPEDHSSDERNGDTSFVPPESDDDEDEEEQEIEVADPPTQHTGVVHHEETIETESAAAASDGDGSVYDDAPQHLAAPTPLRCAAHDDDLYDDEISKSPVVQAAGAGEGGEEGEGVGVEAGGAAAGDDRERREATFHSAASSLTVYARPMKDENEEEEEEGKERKKKATLKEVKEEEEEEEDEKERVGKQLKEVKEEPESDGDEEEQQQQKKAVVVKEREIKMEQDDALQADYENEQVVRALRLARDATEEQQEDKRVSPRIAQFSFPDIDEEEEPAVASSSKAVLAKNKKTAKKRKSGSSEDEEGKKENKEKRRRSDDAEEGAETPPKRRSPRGLSGSNVTPPNVKSGKKRKSGSSDDDDIEEALKKEREELKEMEKMKKKMDEEEEKMKFDDVTPRRSPRGISQQGTPPNQPKKSKKDEQTKSVEKRRTPKSTVKRSKK